MPAKSPFFLESDLRFQFDPSQWKVEQYDRHPFYQALKSQGLKGVDFIGIHQWEEVVLMEVKNYKARHQQHNLQPLLEDPDRLVRHIQRKYEDTLRAIRVVREYYERKWWYRLINRWMGSRSQLGRWVPEWLFWRRASQLAEGLASYRLILWIEWDESYEGIEVEQIKDFQRVVEDQLRKRLGGNGRFQTASCAAPLFPESLVVGFEDDSSGHNLPH
jgi:hypothetical protein